MVYTVGPAGSLCPQLLRAALGPVWSRALCPILRARLLAVILSELELRHTHSRAQPRVSRHS